MLGFKRGDARSDLLTNGGSRKKKKKAQKVEKLEEEWAGFDTN